MMARARRRSVNGLVALAVAFSLVGCANFSGVDRSGGAPTGAGLLVTPAPSIPWTPLLWPGKTNAPFVQTVFQGRPALRVLADRSMSIFRQRLIDAPVSAGKLEFSWLVDGMLEHADLGVNGQDDAPVRVVLAFDGDRTKLSARTKMQSELSRALLGEDLPYATLTYVWCNTRPVGTVLVSPRTDRVRKIVVESGERRVGQWLDYSRDVVEDFRRAFGEEPGPLIGVALMTDADNTAGKVSAWYGALRLTAP